MVEIVVSTASTGLQHQPGVAAFQDMYFVVWSDSTDAGIRGQLFQADGERSGDLFVVNDPTGPASNTNRQFPVVRTFGGGLAVAWVESAFNPPGPRPHVKMQLFDHDGGHTGDEVQVSSSDVDPGYPPAVTGMIDGGFLVVWVDASPDQRIRARRFGPEGTPVGAEFTVNVSPGFHERPVVTRLMDGNYVVVWRGDPAPPGGGSLTFRIFDLEGQPVGGEVVPNLSGFGGPKAVSFLDDGGFVVLHARYGPPSDLGEPQSIVEANFFDAAGGTSRPAMSVNHGPGITSREMDVAALPGGRFLAVWTQQSAETFATNPLVLARIFSTQQGPTGAEVQVSSLTTGDRFQPRTAPIVQGVSGDGAFVAWVEHKPDSSHFAVHGRALRIVEPGELQ